MQRITRSTSSAPSRSTTSGQRRRIRRRKSFSLPMIPTTSQSKTGIQRLSAGRTSSLRPSTTRGRSLILARNVSARKRFKNVRDAGWASLRSRALPRYCLALNLSASPAICECRPPTRTTWGLPGSNQHHPSRAPPRSRASAQRNVGSTGSVPRSGGTSKKRSRGNMEGGDVADPEERRSKRMSISRPCKPSPPPPASASSAQTKADPGKPGKKRDPVLQTASYGVEMLSFLRGHAINFCIVGESLSPSKR